jgi:hypothetical protein
MRQLQLFTSAQLATMRDRTASRNYSPERDAFRREHERHRAWGLIQRHAECMRRSGANDRAAQAPSATEHDHEGLSQHPPPPLTPSTAAPPPLPPVLSPGVPGSGPTPSPPTLSPRVPGSGPTPSPPTLSPRAPRSGPTPLPPTCRRERRVRVDTLATDPVAQGAGVRPGTFAAGVVGGQPATFAAGLVVVVEVGADTFAAGPVVASGSASGPGGGALGIGVRAAAIRALEPRLLTPAGHGSSDGTLESPCASAVDPSGSHRRPFRGH